MRKLLFASLAVTALVAAACKSHGGGGGSGTPGTPSPTPTPGIDVLEHHHTGNRRGVYVEPALTKAAVATLTLDTTFAGTISGNVYAQPLYLSNAGHDLVFAVTENNQVTALYASNGTVAWQRVLAPPMALASLPCGNIDPLGITGTPAIDPASRTLFLDAMTDAGGGTAKHEIYALSVDDGSTKSGWPVDANTAVSAGGVNFDSAYQNQRAALTFLDGKVYVAWGGHYGDCGTYYGWVAGIDATNPSSVSAFRTGAVGAAIWGMSGIANDGHFLYVTTGNTTQPSQTWNDTEAILRLAPGPTFSGATADYYAPSNFYDLDVNDTDLAGTGPVLVDLPGSSVKQLVVALGKDGNIYLADRQNLGGIGGELSFNAVSSSEIINAAASYTTALGTYVVFKGNGIGCPMGQSGNLTAVRITPGAPPTASVAWCTDEIGAASPMVTQTEVDGGDTIVWGIGTEGEGIAGDHRLHGFDGDTGAVVFDGGGAGALMGNLHRYITAIAVNGRIFVGGDDRVYAFKAP
ncbi:MAG TPA: hypothetical protein VMV18_06935 [bacterium]|nr:hypothetical protein [bacterium]